jgi:tetratricopeptide (TPR) repeat protein
MKPFLLLLFFVVPVGQGWSQPPQRQSILNQIPFLPESTDKPRPQLLNTRLMLQDLDPLPEFQIPNKLPHEFVLTREQEELLKLFQDAHGSLQEDHAERAIDLFRNILRKFPNELNIHLALADCLYAIGEYDEAIEHYEFVLERDPLHFKGLNNLAWLYCTREPELQQLDKALRLANLAKMVRPNDHHVWSTLSKIYFQKTMYPEAEQTINNALRIAQQSQVPLQVVVSYLMQRDRAGVAREATSLLE